MIPGQMYQIGSKVLHPYQIKENDNLEVPGG